MKRFILFAFVILLFSHLLPAQDNKVEKWDVYEMSLPGPSAPNPFVGIELSAVFKNGDRTFEPEGFYNGNGIFKIRFMPDNEGLWTFKTESNRDELNGKEGQFVCTAPAPGNHGPVRVRNQYHFAYEDGGAIFFIWDYDL